MAFTDVIDQKNVESVLVLKVELRTVYGNPGSTHYFGDRYMEATVDGANRVISGVVKDWGGFGYQADFANFESVVSDCSLVLSVQDVIQGFVIDQNALQRFQTQEVVGARLTIFQLAKWAGTWESRQVWKGIVREPSVVTSDGITLSAVDLTPMQGQTPNVVISKGAFPNAPEATIGQSIPIVYGDFLEFEAPNPNEEAVQMFGMGTFRGIPSICVDDGRDSIYKAGKFRAMCHGAKATSPNSGVAFHSPGHRDRTVFTSSNWTLTNTAGAPGTGYVEAELNWPLRFNYVPAFPGGIATGNQATNPEHAWDRAYLTMVSMSAGVGQTEVLAGTIPAVNPSGELTDTYVYLWVYSCTPNNKIDFGLWNPTTSSWVAVQTGVGADESVYAKLVLSPPDSVWDMSEYEVRVKLNESANCVIRGLVLAHRYAPANSPVPYRRIRPPLRMVMSSGLDYGYNVAQYKRRVMAEGSDPSDITVMTYGSGLQDDGSGTYTGAANALVEHAADQMHHVLGELSDLASTDIAGSSDHGSFTVARTALGTYHKLAAAVLEKQPVNQLLHRLAFQARSVPIWNADGKRGIITLTPEPSANYRSGSTFDFYADEHFEANSFKFGRTSLERVVNQVYVDFDFDYGANEFRKTTFVTESDSDNGFGTRDSSTGREVYAANSQGRFQVVRDFHMKAYDVVNQGVAKQLRNWIFDWWWRSKLWIEFETYLNASDLSIGHVIQLGDEVINGLTPTSPDDLYYTWDDFTWWTTHVWRVAGTGTTPRYRIRALEAVPCMEGVGSDDWTATADD
jgi:hypothetical protein